MVNIGIIGKGEEAKAHIENILETKGIALSGIFLMDRIKLDLPNIVHFDTIEDIIQDSDAIYILGSFKEAYKAALNSFRYGKHVFIEQISNFSSNEIEVLLNSRKEANVKCVIASLELGHPAFLAIRNEIANPLFIETKRNIVYDKNNSSNIIQDIMLKDIAIILNIVKSDIKRISATGIRVMTEDIDLANARLEFANGCVAVLSANKSASKNESLLTIYESNKMSEVDFESSKTNIISLTAQGDENITQVTLPLNIIHPFIYQLENFRDSIAGKADPFLKLRGGYEKIDIAQKILKKINSSKEE